ncbi:MAG: hypothetical protein WC755_04200 [Candidatus Woesearchaeota archaeon]
MELSTTLGKQALHVGELVDCLDAKTGERTCTEFHKNAVIFIEEHKDGRRDYHASHPNGNEVLKTATKFSENNYPIKVITDETRVSYNGNILVLASPTPIQLARILTGTSRNDVYMIESENRLS